MARHGAWVRGSPGGRRGDFAPRDLCHYNCSLQWKEIEECLHLWLDVPLVVAWLEQSLVLTQANVWIVENSSGALTPRHREVAKGAVTGRTDTGLGDLGHLARVSPNQRLVHLLASTADLTPSESLGVALLLGRDGLVRLLRLWQFFQREPTEGGPVQGAAPAGATAVRS